MTPEEYSTSENWHELGLSKAYWLTENNLFLGTRRNNGHIVTVHLRNKVTENQQ